MAADTINLATVRRKDGLAEEVCVPAGHSSLYVFDSAQDCWERGECAGPLILYRRQATVGADGLSYGLHIVNRLGIEDWSATITSKVKLDINGEFIYIKIRKEIWGLWVFDAIKRDLLVAALRNIKAGASLTASTGLVTGAAPSAPVLESQGPQSSKHAMIVEEKQHIKTAMVATFDRLTDHQIKTAADLKLSIHALLEDPSYMEAIFKAYKRAKA